MSRGTVVSSTDVALLRALARERSVVSASGRVGLTRDQAVYRLGRLSRAFGGAVVESARGGAGHGGTVLTPLGDRIARGGFTSVELLDTQPASAPPTPNVLRGRYRTGRRPEVEIAEGLRLRVAFQGQDGDDVSVLLDPEAIVVARRRFASSARNVLEGTVEALARRGPLETMLVVRLAGVRLRVAVTDEPIRELRLRPGVRVWLYVKATALRPVGPAAP